ncbi:MAG: hypothetical protein JO219_02810 [Candidatus Eremiobacteraeota bacterium]|nr:hypothetical protein [Candidatus Eremiobacteraeota bacterium]MBV8365573.1 hypothetical protein [Candidatus Eremiobacteraeota bacterium]
MTHNKCFYGHPLRVVVAAALALAASSISASRADTTAAPTATPKHLAPQHVTAHFPVPVNTPLGYRVEMSEQFSNGAPFTGALVFKVNNEGIINGVYEADSIRPDPLYGQREVVTGGISSGNKIRLQIGVGTVALTVRGDITQHAIKASASRGGAILIFNGERVHLQKPPQQT